LATQEMSKKPVKVSLPAPLTIINTVMNEYYKDNERELSEILVKEINREVVALSNAGCKYIQVLWLILLQVIPWHSVLTNF
jgi:5-methyltetrahydropteroyltriglutamate--homocysteine methyltransferase